MLYEASLETLALFGGAKAVTTRLRRYNPIGDEEQAAAKAVIESGILSQFVGAWGDDFYGGPKVREFERACECYFGVKHAVTLNSWTSGLIAAVGALGIEPGDEVIVSPWTMCASATAILHWNGIPVFADIEPDTFGLDPASVEAHISPYTRAILVTDIFGHSARMDAIVAIARRHGLSVISDTAQAPGARVHGRFAGTLADVGGFSLNYHKHVHTGEGGILVTQDDDIAERARLIRNHAEAVVGPKGTTNLVNMIGYNFRLGEIECAIGLEQLLKLEQQVASRQRVAAWLTEGLVDLPGLRVPIVEPGHTHVYYVYPLVLDTDALGVGRSCLLNALRAEGVPALAAGYQNIHRLPVFERQIAFGASGFPWVAPICRRRVEYGLGTCPVAERLHDQTFIGFGICTFDFDQCSIDEVIAAFRKVWALLPTLRSMRQSD